MKPITIAALTLLLIACASAPPRHIEGRYALATVTINSQPINEAELTMLRDALSKYVSVVDLVSDPAAATGYDGVIVVRWNQTTNRFVPRRESHTIADQGRVVQIDRPDLPQPRQASQPSSAHPYDTNELGIELRYAVVRNGEEKTSGVVRVPIWPNPSEEQLERWHKRYVRAADTFARDVAKQLGKS